MQVPQGQAGAVPALLGSAVAPWAECLLLLMLAAFCDVCLGD